MNRIFINELLRLDSLAQVERALRGRRDEILQALADAQAQVSEALIHELAELNIAIGDFGPEVDNG